MTLRGTSASDVQHLFYAGASDPRIFRTGKVRPNVLTLKQTFGQSGSRWPSGKVVNREWGEAAITGGLDLGDLVMLLASAFSSKREANGDWRFLSLAGARATGYNAPKEWTKLLSYNWADSGECYEAADPVLKQLEVNYDSKNEVTLSAAFALKEYQKITRPATVPLPDVVDENIVKLSDIRIGLSAGRLGEIVYPSELLMSKWTYPALISEVFGGNQSDAGWTNYVNPDYEDGFNPLQTFTLHGERRVFEIPRRGYFHQSG